MLKKMDSACAPGGYPTAIQHGAGQRVILQPIAMAAAQTQHVVQQVVADLRMADRQELAALGVDDAVRAIDESLAASRHCGLAVLHAAGERACWPVAIYGVATHAGHCTADGAQIGMPWMLGTTRIAACKTAFLKASRRIFAGWCQQYAVLENWAHADHHAALCWLRWLGFQFSADTVMGANGQFIHFYWKDEAKCA
jgi:hypothetical protein